MVMFGDSPASVKCLRWKGRRVNTSLYRLAHIQIIERDLIDVHSRNAGRCGFYFIDAGVWKRIGELQGSNIHAVHQVYLFFGQGLKHLHRAVTGIVIVNLVQHWLLTPVGFLTASENSLVANSVFCQLVGPRADWLFSEIAIKVSMNNACKIGSEILWN